jgi:hypothetical protein
LLTPVPIPESAINPCWKYRNAPLYQVSILQFIFVIPDRIFHPAEKYPHGQDLNRKRLANGFLAEGYN